VLWNAELPPVTGDEQPSDSESRSASAGAGTGAGAGAAPAVELDETSARLALQRELAVLHTSLNVIAAAGNSSGSSSAGAGLDAHNTAGGGTSTGGELGWGGSNSTALQQLQVLQQQPREQLIARFSALYREAYAARVDSARRRKQVHRLRALVTTLRTAHTRALLLVRTQAAATHQALFAQLERVTRERDQSAPKLTALLRSVALHQHTEQRLRQEVSRLYADLYQTQAVAHHTQARCDQLRQELDAARTQAALDKKAFAKEKQELCAAALQSLKAVRAAQSSQTPSPPAPAAPAPGGLASPAV
jgi:hypothetical protein